MGRFFTVAAGLLSLLAVQAGGTGAATGQFVYHGVFSLNGERGTLSIAVAFPDVGTRWWDVIYGDIVPATSLHSGQYLQLAGGTESRWRQVATRAPGTPVSSAW